MLLSIVMGLVGGLIGALVGFASVTLLSAYDQSTQAGFNSFVSNLLDIFIMPFYVTVIVLYYFDLRVRKEKYDFENV